MEKIKYKYLSTILLSFVMLVVSCRSFRIDYNDNKLKVKNNSDHRIYTAINLNYPDTSFINSKLNNEVNAKDNGSIAVYGTDWDEVLDRIKNATIFIINADNADINEKNWLLKIYPLKKIVLNKNQLDSLGWTIYYP